MHKTQKLFLKTLAAEGVMSPLPYYIIITPSGKKLGLKGRKQLGPKSYNSVGSKA